MKKIIKIFLSSVSAIILLSCDPIYYTSNTAVNNSGHRVSLLFYQGGEVNNEWSFFALKNGESHKFPIMTRKGGPSPYILFPGLFMDFYPDSVFIIFNDTLRGAMFKRPAYRYAPFLFGDQNFISNPTVWRKVKSEDRLYHYEYELTGWHYQQVLEAYGLK